MADKTKTIKSATDKELESLIARLRKEADAQRLVRDIKRMSTVRSPYSSYEDNENELAVSTEQPIESLYHYGILGMKWGIRRGPNSTMLTRERRLEMDKKKLNKLNSGKTLSIGLTKKRQDRYNERDKSLLEKNISRNERLLKNNKDKSNKLSEDYTKNKALKKKKIKELSNSELRAINERMQLERTYKDLKAKDLSLGKTYAKKIVKAGSTAAAISTTGITLYNNAEKIKAIIGK